MRIVMMGTGTFAEPTFNALLQGAYPVVGLVTQPDRTVGEARGSTRQTGQGMTAIANAAGVPVFQPESINTGEGVAGLREFNPELLVVAAYGQILSKEALASATKGGINVHGSLLPKYRGAAPVAWAIYHGETQTGVTIIRMTSGLDAGEMLGQEAIEIGHDETAGDLEMRLAPLGARLAVQVIEQLKAGTTRGQAQDKSQVTNAPKLKKDDGLIDWSRGAEQIRNQIRAMQPWPTAYAFLHRKGQPPTRVIVFRAACAPGLQLATESPSPGSIIPPGNSAHLYVATGLNESIEILELQPAGKRRMAAAEFLRGHHLQFGDRFGAETP